MVVSREPASHQEAQQTQEQSERARFDAMWSDPQCTLDPATRSKFRTLSRLLPEDARSVLDAGCGSGELLRQIDGPELKVGTDYSCTAVARLSCLGCVAHLGRLPFADRAFDAVTCIEVLEHLAAGVLRTAAEELSRVARRYLLVGVPYREVLPETLTYCDECGHRYHAYGHVQRFRDVRSLTRLFPGWALRAVLTCGAADYAPAWVARLERQIFRNSITSAKPRCPRCKSGRVAPVRFQRVFRLYITHVAWRLRRRRPRWMNVLLERPDDR